MRRSSLSGLHDHTRTRSWIAAIRTGDLADPSSSTHTWRVDLRSSRAFHPGRLLDDIESLGGGRHRSRGCFWLPTRPHRAIVWDGAGGQLSIGNGEPWGRCTPLTRIIVVGTGNPPGHLRTAFESMLLRSDEQGRASFTWRVAEDGFEPWLAAIHHAA